MSTVYKITISAAVALGLFVRSVLAQVGDDNPTGPAGIFNGNITTAGSYDPYTGNVTRTITDIVVAGAVSPLGRLQYL